MESKMKGRDLAELTGVIFGDIRYSARLYIEKNTFNEYLNGKEHQCMIESLWSQRRFTWKRSNVRDWQFVETIQVHKARKHQETNAETGMAEFGKSESIYVQDYRTHSRIHAWNLNGLSNDSRQGADQSTGCGLRLVELVGWLGAEKASVTRRRFLFRGPGPFFSCFNCSPVRGVHPVFSRLQACPDAASELLWRNVAHRGQHRLACAARALTHFSELPCPLASSHNSRLLLRLYDSSL